jgi:hypothetical protein
MLTKYIGKKYSFLKYNCWDFVVEARKECGIETKIFKPRTLRDAFQVITAQMQKLGSGLTKVDDQQDYDIVIVSKNGAFTSYHCGLCFKGLVVHCCPTVGSVTSCTLFEFTRDTDGVSFWR